MAKLSNPGMTKKFLITEMDRSIKRMMKLIEEEGDSFAKKVEIYIQKRPELVSQVEDFYQMFRSLAERYEKATCELRRAETLRPPNIRSRRLSFTEGCFEPPSTITSPERRLNRRLSESQTFFDNVENKEGYETSNLDLGLDFDDSLFDDYSMSLSNYGNYRHRLHKKVAELESELKRVRIEQEVNRPNSVIAGLEEELRVAKEKIKDFEEEIEELKIKIEKYESISLENEDYDASGSDFGTENNEMEDDIEFLKAKRDEYVMRVSELEKELSLKDDQINEISECVDKLNLEYEKSSKSIEELTSRVQELEKVIEKQREVIEEGVEEKRQAVNQLCFSLEHYRNAYHMLRKDLLEHKKPLMAT